MAADMQPAVGKLQSMKVSTATGGSSSFPKRAAKTIFSFYHKAKAFSSAAATIGGRIALRSPVDETLPACWDGLSAAEPTVVLAAERPLMGFAIAQPFLAPLDTPARKRKPSPLAGRVSWAAGEPTQLKTASAAPPWRSLRPVHRRSEAIRVRRPSTRY